MKTLLICVACINAMGARLPDSGFTVHEWGTFTSVAGTNGAPTEWNALGCRDDLPGFVNNYGYRGFKRTLIGTVRMETPVLYFYSQHDVDVSVKVAFPNGLMTEWYPKADYAGQSGIIEWKSVKIRPGLTPSFPTESAPSPYYSARATDSAPVTVGDQHEKFLFYRGVATIPIPLSARVASDGGVTVGTTGAGTVPAVFLFENRGGAIGYRKAGSVRAGITLSRPTLDGAASQLRADLEDALIAQGLYPREAAAMINTWRDSWFEKGSRLIYILPQSAVDAMLPLTIDPAPAHIARVFVGRIELITPETKRVVREAVANHDSQALALYRRFLEPIGKSIGANVNIPCPVAKGR